MKEALQAPPPGKEPGTAPAAGRPPSTTSSGCCADIRDIEETTSTSNSLCVALVQECGTKMSLFDASGAVRKFSLLAEQADENQDDGATSNKTTLDIRDLCFSSHGKQNDSLLTPCLDSDGNHATGTDENCFCGIPTPHLHAHVKDSNICKEEEDVNVNAVDNSDLSRLVSVTLHPVQESENDGQSSLDDDSPNRNEMFHVPLSDHMPKVCNSVSVKTMSQSSSSLRQRKRLHKVQHDDHVDYLVHNPSTGDLHLEHPECEACGDSDVHGRFTLVGTRQLHPSIQLHFFHPSTTKFSLWNLFEPESSDRVAAATACIRRPSLGATPAAAASAAEGPDQEKSPPASTAAKSCCVNGVCTKMDETTTVTTEVDESLFPPEESIPGSTVVRSKFYCSGICCSSEVPLVHSSLEDLEGVIKIMINVPLRHVLVDHDVSIINATILEDILNQNDFGATIQVDGATEQSRTSSSTTKGKSRFYVDRICCASEIPAINSIVTPLNGVAKVSINVTTKMVYVEHDTSAISAQAICDALNDEQFGANVEFDAATSIVSTSAFVTSIFTIQDNANNVDDNDKDSKVKSLKEYLATIESTLIEGFVVDEAAKKLTVIHNILLLSSAQIASDVKEKTKVRLLLVRDGAEHQVWDFQPTESSPENEDEIQEATAHLRPSVAISGILWIVSMLSYIGGNWEYLKYVALVSVAFGLPPIAMKAFRTMRRFQFDANCLMFFAALGAVALQEFTEAAAVTFLFAFSEWLEVRATTRARDALSAIVKLRPESANLVHPKTGEVITVSASAVPIGALVYVRTGDKIPCDGVLVEGSSTVDESSLTGESRPVRKGPNDPVSGGTINSGSTQMKVRTTATADDSAVARLIRLVEEAQANRSETEQLVDEFARVYTPVIVFAAILMCSIPWIWGRDIGREWTNNGLVLVVVACPCALIISTPVTYVAALANLAARGVLVKGGAYLEALGQVRKICFDKTGTLTEGKFQLIHLDVLTDNMTRHEILEYLLLIEEGASHPLAQAIVDAIRKEGVEKPRDLFVRDHSFVPGEGVVGIIGDIKIHVGNFRMFQRIGLLDMLDPIVSQRVHEWEESLGATVGFMSQSEHGIICCYCVSDAVREEANDVVKELKNRNISVTMLTGDNAKAACAIGKQVGLTVGEGIRSDLLPEEKLQLVSEMKDTRARNKSALLNLFSSRDLVLMCGDGVNDGPALAAADLSIAMGGGAALALETADITLIDSNLTKLLFSLDMGRRVIRKITENVVFSISVKFLVLGFALAGKAHLFAAIASDVGAMLIVTLNSMLLLPSRKRIAKTYIGKSDKQKIQVGMDSFSEAEEKDVQVV